ncbi:hypothetical protein [Variovorax paradoxus]|uniref:hypothetical protein n=1 Tax=Variovorax paradoxus TaxID=34073 RepID=UPI0030D498F8
MTPQRRGVHSPGSPSKTPEPKTGMNPDGRTPADLPSDPATPTRTPSPAPAPKKPAA